jgi:hypothetical protein
VHGPAGSVDGPWRIGARMLDLGEDQLRRLRRWLNAAQAGQVRTADASA